MCCTSWNSLIPYGIKREWSSSCVCERCTKWFNRHSRRQSLHRSFANKVSEYEIKIKMQQTRKRSWSKAINVQRSWFLLLSFSWHILSAFFSFLLAELLCSVVFFIILHHSLLRWATFCVCRCFCCVVNISLLYSQYLSRYSLSSLVFPTNINYTILY